MRAYFTLILSCFFFFSYAQPPSKDAKNKNGSTSNNFNQMGVSMVYNSIDKAIIAKEEGVIVTKLALNNRVDPYIRDVAKHFPDLEEVTFLGYEKEANFSFLSELILLKKITFTFCHFETLPKEILILEDLEHLKLNKCLEMTSLPEKIGQLEGLKRLDIYGAKIQDLPESFGSLGNLIELSLPFNKIESLPESFKLLTSLRRMDLSGNQLSSLSDSLFNLTNLTMLNLSNNQFREIPHVVFKFSNLHDLLIMKNQLQSLPESIDQLHNLRELDLTWNQIQTIPNSITKLKKMENLKLGFNQIKTLPAEIGEMPKMYLLVIKGNPDIKIPALIENSKIRIRN